MLPFPERDVLITIIDGELYFTDSEKMRIYEHCDDQMRRYELTCRNIRKIDSNCWIRMAQCALRPHRLRLVNETNLISPKIFTTGINPERYTNMSKLGPIVFNSISSAPLLINNNQEMANLLREADKLMEQSKQNFYVEQLHYECKSFSTMTVIGGSIMSMGLITVMIYLFRRITSPLQQF